MSEKGRETSGMQSTGADKKMAHKELKVVCWGSVQDQGCVTVRGCGLFLSVVHLPPLSTGSPFTFTVLVIFFDNTFHYIVW